MNKNWHNKFFIEDITEDFKLKIHQELKEEFQKFYKEYDDTLCDQHSEELNIWYYSEEGQKEILRFIKDFWFQLTHNSNEAMPAHDARHALYKVPTYSLKYIYSENIKGWERLGVIGALGHDFGRWAEERIFGNAQGGSTHSRMSYVLLKEFLEDYNLPQIIKLSLLNSVIKHTTGANSDENMHIKLTVSPDRDQLIGPEFILRLLHHKPKDNALKIFFDEPGQESVINAIIKMYFSRLPGPLFSLENELRDSFKVTLLFCLMNTSLDKIMEYKEKFTKGYFSEEMFKEDLIFCYEEIRKIPDENLDVNNEIMKLLSAKNVSPEMSYKEMTLTKIEKLTNEEKKILAKSIKWVNQKRIEMDLIQYKFLEKVKNEENENWIKWLAEELYKEWN